MPRKVDEMADAIMKDLRKNRKDLSEEKMYDIAYGTAWKKYKEKNSNVLLDSLKLAQSLDDQGLFYLADQFE